MRVTPWLGWMLGVLMAAWPASAAAEPQLRAQGDPLWNGVVIGGTAGLAGFVITPRLMCGTNDSECEVIVRLAVGLPLLVGGLAGGALVDKLIDRRPVWQSRTGKSEVGLRPVVGLRSARIDVAWRFRPRGRP